MKYRIVGYEDKERHLRRVEKVIEAESRVEAERKCWANFSEYKETGVFEVNDEPLRKTKNGIPYTFDFKKEK